MKLIEDLGTIPVGTKAHKTRFGLYECPICCTHFMCTISSVKCGHTTKCRSCANKIRSLNSFEKAKSSFIAKAIIVHGNKNCYDLVEYTGNKNCVTIICCGCQQIYDQIANAHLNGQGCPKCCKTGFNPAKSATMYYIRVTCNNTILYKIGITNRSIQERFSNTELSLIQIVHQWDYIKGIDAYNKEQEILKEFKEYKYIGEPILSSGNTELFTHDILNLDIKETNGF